MMISPHKHELFTYIVVGCVVFSFGAFLHEGLGHGLMAAAQGCTPLALTSAFFDSDCSPTTQPTIAKIWVAMAGTFANLLVAILTGITTHTLYKKKKFTLTYYVTWVLFVSNALSGFGYLMTSPLFGYGDWHKVLQVSNASSVWVWILTAIGIVGSLLAWKLGRYWCAPFNTKQPHATLVPYLAGCTTVTLMTLANPSGVDMVISAAMANFLGCSWMVWIAFSPDEKNPMPQTSAQFIGGPLFFAACLLIVIALSALLGPGYIF